MGHTKQYGSLLLILILHLTTYGQKKPFLEHSSASDKLGNPISDNSSYFDYIVFKDTASINFFLILVDSSYLQNKSEFLKSVGEPILNNYFLDKEIIRLTWTRAFNPEIIVRIEKSRNGVLMIQKKIKQNKPIEFSKNHYRWPRPSERKVQFKINSVSKISEETWEALNQLMDTLEFDNMPPNSMGGVDGSVWIIERATQDGWKVVARFTPMDLEEYKDFKTIADFIIDNSRFKSEERY